jgi:hypothetical protein
VKPTFNAVVLILLGLGLSKAQEVDVYAGVGTARASSNGQQIDTFGDNTPHATPGMGGTFPNFGINVFLNKQWGVGWTAAWKASSTDYAGLSYHATFHTFDGIFQPTGIRTKRLAPELRAGIGVSSVHFQFDDQQACDQVPGCPGSHFFLAHAAGAIRWYVSNRLFVRPAVDLHYVYNFFPFGSRWVPRYSVSLGYSFGRE